MLHGRFRRQWLAYAPLAFYLAWLMLRYRSATLYTAANPGIPTGGMTGESKSAILENLARIPGLVPEFTLIAAELSPRARVHLAQQWRQRQALAFPLVLKPDVGERGRAVRVVSGEQQLAHELSAMRETMILQRFVHGFEFGILYRRMPGAARGQVLSIAQATYPQIRGDGRASVAKLVRGGPPIAAQAAAAGAFTAERLRYVPAAGEVVRLFEAGFDCHHAVYTDRRELITAELEQRIDRVSRAHPGFFIGRFDVCAQSARELARGEFKVLELNGVASEPMHIYDPATSLAQALGTLRRQWRDAFEIGAANRALGAQLTPGWSLLRLVAREHAAHIASAFRRARAS